MTLEKFYMRALQLWSADCDNAVLSAILDAFNDNEDFPPIILPAPPVDLFYYSHGVIWRIEADQQRIYL
jgi:hypothetical protein